MLVDRQTGATYSSEQGDKGGLVPTQKLLSFDEWLSRIDRKNYSTGQKSAIQIARGNNETVI